MPFFSLKVGTFLCTIAICGLQPHAAFVIEGLLWRLFCEATQMFEHSGLETSRSTSGEARFDEGTLSHLGNPMVQDDEKGWLGLRGVAVTTETATTAETVKTVTPASWHCIL